jgi:hypothetical protein
MQVLPDARGGRREIITVVTYPLPGIISRRHERGNLGLVQPPYLTPRTIAHSNPTPPILSTHYNLPSWSMRVPVLLHLPPLLTGREPRTHSQFLAIPEAFKSNGSTFLALNSPERFRRSSGPYAAVIAHSYLFFFFQICLFDVFYAIPNIL